MSSQLTIFKGGCMCGAVRYQAQGTPVSVIYCHCESCRRHTGAPVVACAGFKREQVSFSAMSGLPTHRHRGGNVDFVQIAVPL